MVFNSIHFTSCYVFHTVISYRKFYISKSKIKAENKNG